MKVMFIGTYDGQNLKKDGEVILKFKASYSELGEALKTVFLINKMFFVGIAVEGNKIKVGKMALNKFQYDKEGQSTIAFETDIKRLSCSLDEIRSMIGRSVQVLLKDNDEKEG